MTLLLAMLAFAMILLGIAIARPAMLTSGGGKAFGFVGVFAVPVLCMWMGGIEHVERSKTTAFCTSCHVMEKYGKSLMIDDPRHVPASHFQSARVSRETACYSCHTSYTMYGDIHSKLRGLRHLYVQYLGRIPDRIQLYTPYNNRECLHCHNGERAFEESSAHRSEKETMTNIKSGQLSCIATGCHNVTHDVAKLGSLELWAGPPSDGKR